MFLETQILEIKRSFLSVVTFHKSIRPTHFTYKKTFSNMSEFHKIFSFLKNIISLYLTLKRINVKVAVITGGNHLATREFSRSNEIRIKLRCLWCEQQCTGVRELCHQEIWRWLRVSISSWHKLPVLIANWLSEPEKMNLSNSTTIYVFIMRQGDWTKKHLSIFQAPSFLGKFEEQSRCWSSLSSALNCKSFMDIIN